MKPRLHPIDIDLKELPLEGRDFHYTRESGELNEALRDLIDDNVFAVHFRLVPVGNAFALTGAIETELNLECSLCAIDFKFPVKQTLNELLIIQAPLAKGDFQTKTNHAHEWTDQGPDYIVLESQMFHVTDYVHEAIALSEPTRPLGKPDCDLSCENITEPIKQVLDPRLAKAADPIRSNPFQVLEKFKLKS